MMPIIRIDVDYENKWNEMALDKDNWVAAKE